MVLLTDYSSRIMKHTAIRDKLILDVWNLQLNLLDLEEKKKVEEARRVEKVLKKLIEENRLEIYEDKEGRIGLIPPDAGQLREKYILDPLVILLIKTGTKPAGITKTLHLRRNQAGTDTSFNKADTAHPSEETLPVFHLEEKYGLVDPMKKVCKECGKPTKSHQDKEGYYYCHRCFEKLKKKDG